MATMLIDTDKQTPTLNRSEVLRKAIIALTAGLYLQLHDIPINWRKEEWHNALFGLSTPDHISERSFSQRAALVLSTQTSIATGSTPHKLGAKACTRQV